MAQVVHSHSGMQANAVLRRPWPKATLYPVVGTLLALGAPTGLLLLRCVLGGRVSPRWISHEIAQDAVTYGYVTASTLLVFVVAGVILGRGADKLQAFAKTDSLTGLSNRRHFDERVRLELDRERRYGSALSLLLIDVDHLKQINDEHGHEAGDVALKRVARAVGASCRATDLAARWGGDEFTVLAPGTSAEEALALAQRIRETLRRPPVGHGPDVTTVSIGIADVSRLRDRTSEGLYAAADSALYEAKTAGRDRASIHSRAA